jgi:DNA polymerase-3 subunit gamma/tau
MSDNSLFESSELPTPGLALARKWRPRNFATLIGQDHVVQALSHALDQNRLHHAWLFTGTRGVGKTTISRILAKSLNCTGTIDHPITQPTSTPCGQCPACTEIDAGRFVDYVEMDAASNRGINDMISLLEKAIYGPTSGRFKVFMIDEVHMLTNQAFNSMLKTLEEPPPHMKFILATTDPQKIPVTVLSRCLQFNLKQMPSSLIVNHLKTVLGSEQIPIHEGALRIIAKSARGSMRDALSLTDQAIAYSSGNMTQEALRNMLGSLDDSYLIRMVDALASKNGKDLIDISSEMGLMSISFTTALQDLASLLQKIAMAQVIPESVLEEWPEAEDIVRLANLISKEEVQLFYQIAITSRADLLLAPEEETGFMMTLLRMLAFMPDDGQSHSTSSSTPSAPPSSSPQGLSQPKVAAAPVKPSQVSAPSIAPISTPLANAANSTPPSAGARSLQELSPESWRNMVNQLALKGFEGQFALQTALISYQEKSGTIMVKLATDLPQLATTPSIQKLAEALQTYFNIPFKITIEKSTEIVTVAHLEAKDQAIAKTELEKTFSVDPFLEQLKQEIGVTVIEGSIRPLS